MASPLVLLENADLYSPEPLGIGHVLVAGERIAWIGHERLVLPAALAVERVDAEGGAARRATTVACHRRR